MTGAQPAGRVPEGRATAAAGEVRLERVDRVLTVTLDRPAKLNAMTPGMFTALEELCALAARDATLRVVVLRGAGGRALAAGADIAAFTGFTGSGDALAYEAGVVRALTAVQRLPQVTVAVIEGLAVGGGLALATACDLRVATTGSRFGYPIAATLGNCLSAAVLQRCVAVFGEALVRHLVLTAELVDVARAEAVGAVSRLVPAADLEAELAALTDRIAHLAPGTLLGTKRLLDALSELPVGDAPVGEAVDDAAVIAQVYGSDDFRGAVQAFLGKHRPEFSAELPL